MSRLQEAIKQERARIVEQKRVREIDQVFENWGCERSEEKSDPELQKVTKADIQKILPCGIEIPLPKP